MEPEIQADVTAPAGDEYVGFGGTDTPTPVIPEQLATREPAIEVKDLPPVDFGQNVAEEAKPVVPQSAAGVSSRRVAAIQASSVGSMLEEEAKAAGFDFNKLATFVHIESRGNPNAGTGSYKGLGQLSDAEYAKYGDGGDIWDARSNARATIRSLQDKEAKFTKDFGREPSATELYLLHQQGEGGLRAHLKNPDMPAWMSMRSTAEGMRKGDAWARAAIWGNIAQQDKAKFGSVDNVTSADFMRYWEQKVTGGAPTGPAPVNFAQTIKPSDINPPASPSEAEVMQANRKSAEYSDTHSVATEAFAQSSLTARAWSAVTGDRFFPDPTFSLTPELQKDLGDRYGLTKESMESLGNAVSQGHAEYIAQQAQQQQQAMEFLGSYGAVGVGAQLFASLIDPPSIIAGVATGGAADMGVAAAGIGRLGRGVAQAIAGAGTNVALDQASRSMGDINAGREIGMTAATGLLFGSSYGWLARNPATLAEAQMVRKQGAALKRALEDTTNLTPGGSTVGAAANPNATYPFVNEPALAALQNSQVPYSYRGPFGFNLRVSAAGQMKTAPAPFTRLLAGIGQDAVGWADHSVNEISAGEKANLWFDQHINTLHNVWRPSAEAWAKEQGINFMGVTRGGSTFNDLVTAYVRNKDPSAEFSEHVARVGDKIRELNEQIRVMARNPGERAGLVRRAVQGFEDVPANKNYMTRVYDTAKLNELRGSIGDKGISEWTKGAIRKAQPDLTDDEINKLAKWHVQRITERANGIDDKLNLALSGYDREQLRDVFREAGIEDERINGLLNSVTKDSKTGADARAKHRLLLAEDYELKGYPTTDGSTRDVNLSHMTVTDAVLLSHAYWRHMTGRIALADFQVRNPETGEMLINGITSDNEILAVKNQIARHNADVIGGEAAKRQTEKDHANLDYMLDRVLARSDKDATGEAARWLMRFGDLSYARLGANFGFAQLPESIAPIAHLGIKAVRSHIPGFRTVINTDGERVLKDGMSREIEAMWGLGADQAKGFQHFRHDDLGADAMVNTNRIDNALGYMKGAVSKLSGLHIINAALQRWTGKAIMQKFADMARKATEGTTGAIDLTKLSESQLRRMRYLGLSDDMLKRVLKEVRENFTTERGMYFDHKVTRLNMDKWKDQEARAAFESSTFRQARNIIQQNDIGNLHRWMSKPVAKMLMQFRIFPLVAWEKQMLHNLHMHDMQSFNLMWMSMAAGAATYALQTQITAIGRSDREEFLQKRLSPDKLALGGFQRAGWSTLLPTLYDTGAYMVGGHPAFDFRTTGQASDALFGNPVMSTLDDISKASKALVQPLVQGRERSQQEYRNINRMLPLSATWLPATTLLSTMVKNKPLMPPKENQQR